MKGKARTGRNRRLFSCMTDDIALAFCRSCDGEWGAGMSQPEGRRTDDGEDVPGGGAEAGEPPGSADAVGASGEGGVGTSGAGAGEGSPQREAGALREPPTPGQLKAGRSPLFYAQHAGRYQRQQLVRDYQAVHDCRLVVMIGPIFDYSIMYFEELIFDASPLRD